MGVRAVIGVFAVVLIVYVGGCFCLGLFSLKSADIKKAKQDASSNVTNVLSPRGVAPGS